jgi:hypothetical protein
MSSTWPRRPPGVVQAAHEHVPRSRVRQERGVFGTCGLEPATASRARWRRQAVVDVANLLQTEDLYHTSKPRKVDRVPSLPDLLPPLPAPACPPKQPQPAKAAPTPRPPLPRTLPPMTAPICPPSQGKPASPAPTARPAAPVKPPAPSAEQPATTVKPPAPAAAKAVPPAPLPSLPASKPPPADAGWVPDSGPGVERREVSTAPFR